MSEEDTEHTLVELDTCSESDNENENDRHDSTNAKLQGLPLDCCSQRCTATFSIIEIESLQTMFKLKNQTEQSQWILDQLIVALATAEKEPTFAKVKQLILNGRKICKKAFINLLGTSYSRVKAIYDNWRVGVKTIIRRKRKTRQLSTKYINMITWLEAYADKIGEKMPHLDKIHLPHFLTKKAVYQIMKSKYYLMTCFDSYVYTGHYDRYVCQ